MMKTIQQPRPTNGGPLWLRVLGALLALQLLGAIALQFAPELHHDLHDHAHAPDHTCLITLLQTGAVELSAVMLDRAVIELSPATVDLPRVEFHLPSVAHQLPPERAPPILA